MSDLSWLRLILLGFAIVGPDASAAGQPVNDARPFQIYMIQWRGPTETDRGFTEYFEQEGIPATFIVRDANREAKSISAFVREIKELQPDLVYVWGGAAPPLVVGRYDAVDRKHHVVDIPVVACMVADPIELGVVPSWVSSGRNVTGTSHVAPLDVQVRAMQAYAPLRHLAVIYNTTEPGPGVVVEKLRALSGGFGFRLTTWSVPLDAEGKPRPDDLPELVRKVAAAKPDFLYLGPDSFLGANRQIVTDAAIERKLPTFVSSEIYIKEASALAGIVSRYYNMGQFCAFKAEQILVHGTAPKDIPFETLKRFSYMIRIDTARAVDHFPPLGLLDMAEIVGN
jgi:putative tryptophan/tyrosine transport system substrate-binding protein